MKKLIMLILSVLLMLTSVNPVCALAKYSPAQDFEITADGAVKYCGQDDIIIIPPEIYGIKVTTIAERAFANQNATKIVVPDTVTHIEDQAFAFCVNLNNLVLPMNLEYVGEEGPYGIQVNSVNGEEAIYETDAAYWGFFVNGEYCNYGISEQPVEDGDAFQIIYTVDK